MADSKTALITGGSSGIGLAIANELAERGYNLLLVSNQPENLRLCQEDLSGTYDIVCDTLEIDLTQTNSAIEVHEFCQTNKIEVEILVNNAGMLLMSEVVMAPPETLSKIIQLHVHTPTLLCHIFGSQMKAKKHGHIMNVSSISSVMPYPGISLYGPTKTFLRYFTRAFRTEMKSYGVNVSCLIPGATITALYDLSNVNVTLAKNLGVMHTPQFVARKAVRGMMRNQAVITPGILNKLILVFMPLIPPFVIYFLNKKMNFSEKSQLLGK